MYSILACYLPAKKEELFDKNSDFYEEKFKKNWFRHIAQNQQKR